jgi:hypothetical protein
MHLKASYKKANLCVLALLILMSAGMLYFTKDIKSQMGSGSRFINGPKFYPMLLAVLMIVFCIISIADTLRKPDKVLEFPNAHKAIVTAVITFVWILSWQYVGHFYLLSFIAMAILLFYLNPAPSNLKKLCRSLAYDGIIMICLYLVFKVALKTTL